MALLSQSLNTNKGCGEQSSLAQSGWHILKEEVSLPVAVLSESALQSNAKWMQTFSDQSGVKLAPHGKTSMAPELFKQQLASGCWGMSLATIPQVVAAYQQGIKRVILANQLVGKFNCEQLSTLLNDSDFEFYCFVDSIDNAKYLSEFFAERNQTVNLLIEIGVDGGRCGWRDFQSIETLVNEITHNNSLNLAGIGFYEGVIHGDNAEAKIVEFISQIKTLFNRLAQQKQFSSDEVIITGAGSAWYDVVAKELAAKELSDAQLNYTAIIRPGCYLIHDTGIYQDAQNTVMARSQLACDISAGKDGDLISSLTVWAYVQSLPEKGLAIIGLGKRDAAFDAGLPTPELVYRPNDEKPQVAPNNWRSLKIMDQHLMLDIGENSDLKVGDMICFSTSHPCLTLDKWRKIGIVNDDFVITKQVDTYF